MTSFLSLPRHVGLQSNVGSHYENHTSQNSYSQCLRENIACANEDYIHTFSLEAGVAQAEHGGFYQAVADGTYESCGLKVSILPGGPQVNNRALLLAGKLDYHMGGDMLQAFNAAKENIPVVAVAAMFQKADMIVEFIDCVFRAMPTMA